MYYFVDCDVQYYLTFLIILRNYCTESTNLYYIVHNKLCCTITAQACISEAWVG